MRAPCTPRTLLVLPAALLAFAALAQTDALQLKRAADLHQAPLDSSASVASLPAHTSLVRTGESQGAWLRVQTSTGQAGWLHLFDVTAPPAPSSLASSAEGALRGLSSLFGRSNAPATTNTSTLGIRGLQAQDIANAEPNLTALAQAEGYRSDAAQARRFGTEAQLQVRAIDALPEPAPPAIPAPPTPGSGRTGASQ